MPWNWYPIQYTTSPTVSLYIYLHHTWKKAKTNASSKLHLPFWRIFSLMDADFFPAYTFIQDCSTHMKQIWKGINQYKLIDRSIYMSIYLSIYLVLLETRRGWWSHPGPDLRLPRPLLRLPGHQVRVFFVLRCEAHLSLCLSHSKTILVRETCQIIF